MTNKVMIESKSSPGIKKLTKQKIRSNMQLASENDRHDKGVGPSPESSNAFASPVDFYSEVMKRREI